MRLSRTSLMMLGAGALAIIFTSLFFNYLQKVRQRDVLLQSVDTAQRVLTRLNAQTRALEPQLAQMEEKIALPTSRLKEAKAGYPASVEAIEYGTELCQIADDCGLVVVYLTNTAAKEEQDGNVIYNATTFDITVKGKIVDLLDFIHIIAMNKYFTSASMVSLDVVDMMNMRNTTSMIGDEPSLSITITIYSYKGD